MTVQKSKVKGVLVVRKRGRGGSSPRKWEGGGEKDVVTGEGVDSGNVKGKKQVAMMT